MGSLRLEPKQYRDVNVATDQVKLQRPDDGADVVLLLNGEHYQIGRIASAFPISSSLNNIAFFNEEGEEIGVMKEVNCLDEQSRQILKEELEKAYFMPRIQAVLRMDESLGVESWTVETDKGERTFEVRDPRRNVRRISGRRVLIKDVDGNRYEVPNWAALDKKSIALLMRHL
jgi:hypothetical protein